GLMSLFPTRNMGLELAAILMIFTAQAWNLALSFYNSLKSLPDPLRDACRVAGWRASRTFWQLEVPAAAQGLVWNGMLSMAGGWFFLMVNEAFRLGDRDFRLPGIGSYMSVALDRGDTSAMALAILAMVVMIVCVDQLLWRPLVVWVEKFRLDETAGGASTASSWMLDFLRLARLPRRAKLFRRRAYLTARRATRPFERPWRAATPVILRGPRLALENPITRKVAALLFGAAVAAVALAGLWQLWLLLAQLGRTELGQLASSAALTFARVMAAVVLSTAWALPAGVVIGRSPRLARALQPVIQVVASFPAPMLFPIVILLFERIGVGLGIGAVALMVLAGQWYILFNVISAVAAIPEQLKDAAAAFQLPPVARWRTLYLPAAFPALVTGWARPRGGRAGGTVGVRQEHAAAAVRRALPAHRRVRAVSRAAARRRAERRGDGVPIVRAASLAHGRGQRGDGARGARGGRPSAAGRGRPRDQPGRARRFRAGLPPRAVGGDEAARRLRAGARGRARDSADGRAVRGARSADRREPAQPGGGSVARPVHRREHPRGRNA